MRSRWVTSLVVGTLVLSACGSGSSETDAEPTETPTATEAPADGSTASSETAPPVTDPPAVDEDDSSTAATAAPDSDAGSTEASADDSASPATTAPTTDATGGIDPTVAPTTAPPTEVWPDDGCSTDGSPTETDVAVDPAPTIEIRAASASNDLPDLAVRRVNCAGGWANLKNELPADRPVLAWFWAPH